MAKKKHIIIPRKRIFFDKPKSDLQGIGGRPLISDLLSKQNLKKLQRKSFIERNAIIQSAIKEAEKRRRK